MAAMNNPPRLIDIAGITVELRRGGSGTPLLVIHGELGVPGWLESFVQLAEHHDVIVPSLPGYGRSTRPDWVMGVHDLAAWVTWFARDVDLHTPINVIGYSLGGWVAAEIATVASQLFNRIVLVGAMGIKPERGEIFDYFLESGLTGLRRAFHRPEQSSEFMRYWGQEWTPEEADLAEQHREMTCRIAWSRVEDWRAGLGRGRATFPAPSTSNAACGFPALRSPICFMSRLMGPILPGRLSACRVALDSR